MTNKPNLPNFKRDQEWIDKFLNYETQVSIAKASGVSPSRVNGRLTRLLGRKKMLEVKEKKRKLSAKKYRDLYLKK